MSEYDNDLKKFFSEMHDSDQKIMIPDFDEMLPKRKPVIWYLIPAGVAASILIFVGVYTQTINPPDQPGTEVTFHVLIEPNEPGTQSLLSSQAAVYSWEAPSNSLINDYHEW